MATSATVLLINPFRVFEGREEEFLALWDATGRIFSRTDGYVHARLCRAMSRQPPGQHPPYTHVNIAEWRSLDAYSDALRQPALAPFIRRYRSVSTYDPGVYEVIREI